MARSDIHSWSSQRGHIAMYRSLLGWYVVDRYYGRSRLGLIREVSVRTRHLSRTRAFEAYTKACKQLDGPLPPEHHNCRCVVGSDVIVPPAPDPWNVDKAGL